MTVISSLDPPNVIPEKEHNVQYDMKGFNQEI
jgi:hypothetical protein